MTAFTERWVLKMKDDKINLEELSYHKIACIKTLELRNRYSRLNGKNSVRGEHGYGDNFLIKEILTDQGARGWGLYLDSYDKEKDGMLIGRRVSDVFQFETGILGQEYFAYDFALHDLAGCILNVPVYRMLGGSEPPIVHCYDGVILMDDISPDIEPGGLSRILEECKADYELGYRDFKIKIGRAPKWMDWKKGLKEDIEVTTMIRDHYPDAKIMVDANSVYTMEKMKQYINATADCKLYWIEEPFVENYKEDLELKEYINDKSPGTMIADGEANPQLEKLLPMAEKGVIDVLQMDIASFGFTNWRKLLPKLQEHQIKISPHNWGLKIKTHYTANLAASYSYIPTIEGIIDETEGVDFSGYHLNQGRITIPDKAGFGMELIWGKEI